MSASSRAPASTTTSDPSPCAAATPAHVVPSGMVRVRQGPAALIGRAPPEMRRSGPWRLPKVYRLPDGRACATLAVGEDTYIDQDRTPPCWVSSDDGRSWSPGQWPHPAITGMHPTITPLEAGEFWVLPVGKGLRLEREALPGPVGSLDVYVGFELFRLEECPAAVRSWFTEVTAVRWTPATQSWNQERVRWDHRSQLVWCCVDHPNQVDGIWTQKLHIESPVVRLGSELLHADYWHQYADAATGAPPAAWECHLMASQDNGRSWQRRSVMARRPRGDNTGEPVIAATQEGDVVGVMRREVGDWRLPSRNPSLYLVRSSDAGRSWSAPQTLFGFGVFPRLLQLGNGVLVLSFGRPGVWLSFSRDNGRTWTEPEAVFAGAATCGYTSLLALSADTFLMVWTESDHPDEHGRPCKTMFARQVEVRPA